MTVIKNVLMTIKTELWWTVTFIVMVAMVVNVTSLSGPNVCMVKQKYNITKRVKYRAPMSVRTYEWCFAMPPRCSKWNTEMRDLTRLETEERTAEMAVCCPGYKLKDVSCVPTCPSGKTGQGCTEDCPWNKWGPSCAHDCLRCHHGRCDAVTGECRCQDGWQGESCETSMTTTAAAAMMEQLLTTESASTKTTTQTMPTLTTSSRTIATIATSSSASTPSSASMPSSASTPTRTSTINTVWPVTTTSTSTSTEAIQTTIASTPITSTSLLTIQKDLEFTKTFTTPKINMLFSNVSSSTVPMSTLNTYTIAVEDHKPTYSKGEEFVKEVTKESKTLVHSSYNRTEIPSGTSNMMPPIFVTTKNTDITTEKSNVVSTFSPTTTTISTKVTTKGSTALTTTTNKPETRKTTTTVRQPTTKLKPKEIWIKPAQKEPEHITAVMGDKGNERSTIDLISVISIAGGVMLAVITVAIVIVMLERCKKPRYEDVRKYNDIRMQVMIDNNDVPPPYVRSIFHTPLPDPPTSEKCHYQPISTLDRNLKQFMRPVVVQTISPLMLENFRGILECHYDHLPRRSQDMGTLPARCSVAQSIGEREELLPPPRVHSLTDSDIEAMKCEAKLDVIDNTTSEPLYAEIPCWRPPSAHAIEVVNTNGEAVTEL